MFAEESFVNDVAYGALPAGTTADLDALIKLAPDAPRLADELGAQALRSSMSPELRQTLVTALSARQRDTPFAQGFAQARLHRFVSLRRQ
jgi:hypothetical protein